MSVVQAYVGTQVGRQRATLIIQLVVIFGMVFGTLVAVAPAASASSTICAMYGREIKYRVQNGSFCSSVSGTGTRINKVTGNFGTAVPNLDRICAPSIKIDLYDRYGRWLSWRQGARAAGCYWGAYNSVPGIAVNADFPAARGGRARVTLQDSGNSRVEVWHDIR